MNVGNIVLGPYRKVALCEECEEVYSGDHWTTDVCIVCGSDDINYEVPAQRMFMVCRRWFFFVPLWKYKKFLSWIVRSGYKKYTVPRWRNFGIRA